MSMRAYGVDAYGFWFTGKAFDEFIDGVIRQEKIENEENISREEAIEVAWDILNDNGCSFGEIEGTIDSIVGNDAIEQECVDENVNLFCIDRPRDLTLTGEELDAAIKCVKTTFGKYFPEDFDFTPYLVHLYGSYWG